LIPCDGVWFDELDVRGRVGLNEQILADGDRYFGVGHDQNDYPHYWEMRNNFLPYSYSARTGDTTSVLRWSDFYTKSELKSTAFHQYLVDIAGTDAVPNHAMFVPLPAWAGHTRRVAFFDSNRDFSERDRLVLQLLRPHLHEVYLDAERRRHAIPQVSRREREVLQLAAQDHSNADIARILFISVSTVRKHMEHIFDRTGVRTRSAAAALALPQVRPFTQPRRQTGDNTPGSATPLRLSASSPPAQASTHL
jgi:DNA-binding CsgD family transcriptional regulator